jgi:hypothetical protein
MSISALSNHSNQEWAAYYKTRRNDLAHLDSEIRSGDLAGARQAYQDIIKLGRSGPFRDKEPFGLAQRDVDFAAIGKSLHSGNLAAAQHAFQTLQETFFKRKLDPPPAAVPPSAPAQSSNVSIVA